MRKITVGEWIPTQKEREYVQDVLNTARLSYGPYSRRFEQEFSALHGSRYGVLSNSGTSSLHVALQALKELHGWQDGDEVIIPALTFVATANVVLHNRLTPVLVDIEASTYNLNPFYCPEPYYESQLRLTLKSGRVRAIMPVHLFGQPANMRDIRAIAKNTGLLVVADSCESIGATHNNKPVGSWADVSAFSFYMAHIITTGVGGMAITDSPDYAQKMRSLVNFGLDIGELPTGEQYDPSMLARKFLFNSVGHSFRVTEMEAALGLAQLETLGWNIKQRQENAAYMIEGLRDLEEREILRLPHVAPGNTHSYMMFAVTVLSETKHGLMRHLSEHGIGVRDAVPLTTQPCYTGLWNPADYPQAAFVNEHGLYWGSHPWLEKADLDYLIEVVHDYFS